MREIVKTDQAPAAIGPYSQAVKAGSLVFCSGQIALDPSTAEIVGETVGQQCQQVMKNLKAVLEAAGSSLEGVLKTTIYLADMNDFGEVNEIYGSFFVASPPARATVEVSRLPKDVRVEIDAVAQI